MSLQMFNILKQHRNNEGTMHVKSDLHWLRHVRMTTLDHEFTPNWGKKMEELVILVGSIHAMETPPMPKPDKPSTCKTESYSLTRSKKKVGNL